MDCPTRNASLWAYWHGAGTRTVPCEQQRKEEGIVKCKHATHYHKSVFLFGSCLGTSNKVCYNTGLTLKMKCTESTTYSRTHFKCTWAIVYTQHKTQAPGPKVTHLCSNHIQIYILHVHNNVAIIRGQRLLQRSHYSSEGREGY